MSTFPVGLGKGPIGTIFSLSTITWISAKLGTIILLFFSSQSFLDRNIFIQATASENTTALQLHIFDQYVVMDNGILQVNLSKPEGMVVGIQYQGIDNLLEVLQDETNRGYWDLVWSAPGITRKKGAFDRIEGTNFTVIVETEDQIELSFTRMWDPSLEGKMVPLNIDKRFVLLSNSSGFYTYAIYEHLKEWPAFNLTNTRTVFKLRKDKYWDLVWSGPGIKGTFDVIKGTSFTVIVENEEQVELSFTRTWDPSLEGKYVPLNIDKRFVMLRASSGFYSYAIYEHLKDWPDFEIGETRITFKLRKDRFQYMAISDNRQKYMPLPDDRMSGRCQTLAYPEAVLLLNPKMKELTGEVDDKYQYSCENKDNQVHGWICTNPPVGFWQITPSDEFRSGGPLKQSLTSHVGPTTLAMFLSSHYAGQDLVPKFRGGEPWKKVFGPVFIYLNSAAIGDDPFFLWEDAKIQMMTEVQSWPYSFPASEDFQKSDQRGNVSGRLLVFDRYVNEEYTPANDAYVGLAPPGDAGSWQRECKDYQFWTRADDRGYFSINNIRTGTYNLYAWVPGFIGDYRYEAVINITSGSFIEMGDIVYEPPRDGPTLWEIGIPDRSAAEFYVPDPDPKHINKLFVNHPDRFRQYGLWSRYTELYPDNDLVYIVGVSDYTKDWFFAQIPRQKDNTHEGTTWQIKFKLENVDRKATYKLRVAIASATLAEMQVRINDPQARRPLFTSGLIGRDNSVARHGIHGIYWLFNINVPGAQLVEGDNTIFLTQPRCTSPFQGIMYDYIRLEGPPSCGLSSS